MLLKKSSWRGCVLVAEIGEGQGGIRDRFSQHGDGCLQVIALGAGDAHDIALNGGLQLELGFLHRSGDAFGEFLRDAGFDRNDLFDLVATDGLDLAEIQKAHVDIAFGHFAQQHVADLAKLEFTVSPGGDDLVAEFDLGGTPLEVETVGGFLAGLVDSIANLDQVGLKDSVERWHGAELERDNDSLPEADCMDLLLETDVPLAPMNTFGVAARAARLVRVHSQADVRRLVDHPQLGIQPKLVLGGGSNVLLTTDPQQLVVKVEIEGLRVLLDDDDATIIEAGAGVKWHELVRWSLAQGYAGLENLALIPGTVGAAPVQNIGAYGLELADRFHSLDAVDLTTGRMVTLDAAACRFGYRDSLFKRELAGKSLITHVRLRLPKPWVPRIGYADLERHFAKLGLSHPSAQQIFDAVSAIRRAKLPDPALLGNAGSFFKNPVVNRTIRNEILQDFPEIVSYPLDDGTYKLAAAWMIEACGWKGRALGHAAVDARHALVLVNKGGASGREIKVLAEAVQQAVLQKFGITLEFEPVVV